MNKELKIDYLRRLFSPFKKDGKTDCFVFHYLQGSGNELKEKFWSSKSSSRLCFDLYSWMGSDDGYESIEFEKKLPGIKSGGRQISPNMDVFFKHGNDLVFIESKYTETAINRNYLKDLPEAYWNTQKEYKSVSGKKVSYSMLDRYHQKQVVMEEFVSFINSISILAEKEEFPSWFDAKQETCHLLGIVLYALDPEKEPSKHIYFNNVAANYQDSQFATHFSIMAEDMVRRIFKAYSITSSFDYQLCSVRDYFGSMMLLDKKAYKSDKTVREIISDRKLYKEPIL